MKHTTQLTTALLLCIGAHGSTLDYKDWTAATSGGTNTFTNTSSAGTISGSSPSNGFTAYPGTWGVPTAITSKQFTNEFSAYPVGASMTFNFSTGYGWGTGGGLIIGNIHNEFEYTLSAWDFANNPININTAWTIGPEYQSSAPGSLGYFSTSSTLHSASGNSLKLFVNDGSDPNSGQGGVFTIDGLVNVGRIQLTLSSTSLNPNNAGSDFMLFNVGTPTATPEPAALGLCGAGLVALGALRRRRRSSTN
jgi:hypothetical protein